MVAFREAPVWCVCGEWVVVGGGWCWVVVRGLVGGGGWLEIDGEACELCDDTLTKIQIQNLKSKILAQSETLTLAFTLATAPYRTVHSRRLRVA